MDPKERNIIARSSLGDAVTFPIRADPLECFPLAMAAVLLWCRAMISPSSRFTGDKLLCIRGERVVFTKLDFSVASGEALLLLGPNGSGKSSLLRVMAGLLKAAGGHLSWDGVPVLEDREAHSARVHYVGHHDAIKPVLSVLENLRFWARLHDSTAGDATARAALETLELLRLAEVPGKLLSAGQKRRLNLARLLAAPAPLWLLDEPTVALDRASVRCPGRSHRPASRQRRHGRAVHACRYRPAGRPRNAT